MSFRMLVNLYNLKNNLRLKPSELRRLQEKKLRAIISYAYENVSFYHNKFRSSGLGPSDIKAVEDLVKVPLTTKSEIQATPLREMIARDVDVNKCLQNKTSGSTGIPTVTIVGKRTVESMKAIWLRAFMENGLRVFDKRVTICEPHNIPKKKSRVQLLGIMQRDCISVFDPVEEIWAKIAKEKPDIIESYPSSLAILANFCRENNYSQKFRLAFTQAELLDTETRRLISSTFDSELFDYYGSAEFSLMAWECREHAGYHISADDMVFEFLNDGKVVAEGERGEIICTGLSNYEMPLIRYQMNDVGVPVQDLCSCGTTLPLMKMIDGRSDDFLRSAEGRVIPPSVFFPYPFESTEGIKQWRVVQERKDKIRIQLVIGNQFLNNEQVWRKAQGKIRELFGKGMQVEFQIVEEIPRNASGKLRKIISLCK